MVWLIGNKGMLGTDVELMLREKNITCIASDMDVDITEITALRNFIGDKSISWIINCSAYTAVDKAEDEQGAAFAVNASGVKNIALVAKEKNAKLVHISTDYVYDGSKSGEYLETDDTGPVTAYGKSKLQGEKNIIQTWDRFFIFRISWLFGKHGQNFVYTMLRLFSERDEITVVNDQFGSPTYAHDLAVFLAGLVRTDETKYGIYHFSNEGRTTWFDFAGEAYRLVKENRLIDTDVELKPVASSEYPTKAKRPANSYMSKDKVKKTFGIEIRPWQDALRDFIEKIE